MYLKVPGADGHHVIGVSRCAIGEADLMSANLDVGNIHWIAYKEAEEEIPFRYKSPYTNKRYFLQRSQSAKGRMIHLHPRDLYIRMVEPCTQT